MFGVESLSVEFLSSHLWLVIPAGLAGLALAVWLYYRTNPPLPIGWRLLLGLLRGVAVTALILALAQPMLSLQRQLERPFRLSVLVDRSGSMTAGEQEGARSDRVDSLLSLPAFDRLARRAEVTTWYLGENLADRSDEVDGDATALGEALYQLAQEELSAPADHWLLFSDGNNNSGREPSATAGGLGRPISAINVSRQAGRFDVGLGDQEFNPVVFSGQPTEVLVRLNWRGAGGQRIPVELESNGRVLAEATVVAEVEDGRGEARLRFTPTTPGQKLMTLNVPNLPDEQNQTNNRRSFSIKVLRSRVAVLLVSSRPDYEVGFLKRFLDQSDRHDATFISTGQKSGGQMGTMPTRQPDLNQYDLVILHDPDVRLLQSRREILNSYLTDRGGALWLMMGPEFAGRNCPDWLREILPFAPTGTGAVAYVDFRAEPDEGNLLHPVVRLADDQASIRRAWADLPPFQTLVMCDETNPQGVELAYYQRGEGRRYPALGMRRQGPGKVLASAALPFWTWGFVNLGLGGQAELYDRFVEGTLSWLTVSDDLEPVRVNPLKDVFTRGEQIEFDGFAYDAGFRPLSDVVATLRLESETDDNWVEADFVALGEGRYRASLNPPAPGTYRWTAELSKAGSKLRTQTGRLVVEEFALEEFDRRADPDALVAIARASGGQYYDLDQSDQMISDLSVDPIPIIEQTEAGLWGQWWLLLLFVTALGLEWILRKINQLI